MSVSTVNSLYTALSGIQTTQALLNTTTRNITNAQSPGYVRKEQGQVSNAFTGGSLAGPIRRFIDASLLQKLRTNNAEGAFNDVRSDALTKMNQLAGDPEKGTSVSAQINSLGAAFQEMTANPQDLSAAEAVLDAAHNLALSFNEQNDALLKLRQDANIAIVDQVTQVNKQLQLIASLNQKVVNQQALDRDPTDLMDQRDVAISDLSKLMSVNCFTDNQGVVQVLASDFHPLAGLYAEVVTYNQVTHAVAVSGHEISQVGGKIGGNIQVMDGDALQRLQNLSEVANNLTSIFQGLPTSIVSLGGTLVSPAPAAGGADVAIPGVTKLITDNGNQYSATLAYRSTGNGSTYQLVVAGMVAIDGAPQVTSNGYTAATGTGGYVIGTVDVSTTPPTFAGSAAQLTPSTATTQPGVVRLLTAFTNNLSGTAANAPTNVTANNTTTLFTQSSGAVPSTTLALTGAQLPLTSAQFQDTAASGSFTLTTDNGNQYTATIAFRPVTPGVAGSGWQVVVTSLTGIGTAPGTASLNYTAGTAGVSGGTGGLVIGTFDASTNPPTFFSKGTVTGIPAASPLASKFPGHIEPITSITGVTTGAATTAATVTATNNITSPYYAGNIQVSPTITARALQVGDLFKGTTQDNNAGAAQSAVLGILNRLMTFSTGGISASQTIKDGAAAMTVGIGQDLSNTNNKITELTTQATQIQQAIAPDSEVNLDTEMSKLVVLQTAYQANARVVNTVANLLDTLINLAQ